MDQGLYGGLVGGNVRFIRDPQTGHISSMVYPVLEDLAEIEQLEFNPESTWYRRYLDQLEVFARQAEGKFGISHLIVIDGLNFLFELVGATRAYLALEDKPELIEKSIRFARAMNLHIQQTFFERVPDIAGGTCSNYAQWLPGRIVSESIDPFHMASLDYFERWGRPVVEDMFARFDGGIVHIHGNGRHLLEAVPTLKGLQAVFMGDDTGYPPSFDILDQARSKLNDIPIVCQVDFPVFEKALKEQRLLGGVIYNVMDVPDTAAANRCMEKVRRY